MIDLHKDGDIWTVTINRPEKAGALTGEMLVRLADIADSAREAKVVVLTGTGDVFSAGADLDEARAGLATDPVWERLSTAIAALPGLSIAALNGTVAGGALGMVLACDLRIAVPAARFFYPVMRLGFQPQPSDPRRLARLVGPSRAKMILMAGEKIDAAEAHQWGLVDRIVDKADLLSVAKALGAAAASADIGHIDRIKSSVGDG